jgi:hypothetical protein
MTSVECLQEGLNLIQQCVAGCRQLERTSLTLEQTDSERILQLLHLMTHRGRCQEQLVGGELEAAMTRSNTEGPEIPYGGRTG